MIDFAARIDELAYFLAIRRAMRLDVHDSARAPARKLARLRRLGLIQWRPQKMVSIMLPDHALDMIAIICGCAFHDARPCPRPPAATPLFPRR
jgi:hypothetical protein